MNKGIRGRKSSKVHGVGVMRCYKRTSRANFDRQERAIERTQRQRARREIASDVAATETREP